jgi:hypothetical protein
VPADLTRPLFIALRREHFEAFRDGRKRHEWRRYSKRWSEQSCPIGRRVTLSLGYSGARLFGLVIGFQRRRAQTAAQAELFGEGTVCAVIEIRLI